MQTIEKKKILFCSIIIFVVIFVLITPILLYWNSVQQNRNAIMWDGDPEITIAKHHRSMTWINYSAGFIKGSVIVFFTSAFLLIIGLLLSHKKRLDRQEIYKITRGENVYVLPQKSLNQVAGMIQSEIEGERQKAMAEIIGKGDLLENYQRLAKTMSPAYRRVEIQQPDQQEALPEPSYEVPKLSELLLTGQIAPGKDMILGYDGKVPRRGSFLDIYSAAVAGESGSGKTATLLYLIACGLVAFRAKYYAIDPHYPHPKSLGAKTEALWKSGLMEMATDYSGFARILCTIERIIDQRLKQQDTNNTPVVLVIDELAFLSKTKIGKDLAHTMERVSMEGRKCGVYMLASSQTWLAARTGENSVVRDTLTSAYVHRIKPKQANLLLQDKTEVEKLKKHVKDAGQVLLCPVGDESVVCRIPFATESDMQVIARTYGNGILDGQKGFEEPRQNISTDLLFELFDRSGMKKNQWISQISKESGVSFSMLEKIMSGRRNISPEIAEKLSVII